MVKIVVTRALPEIALERLRRARRRLGQHVSRARSPCRSCTRPPPAPRRSSRCRPTASTRALLAAIGTKLKIVANFAVGYDNIDVDACRAAGVAAIEHARHARRDDRRSRVRADARDAAAHRRGRPPDPCRTPLVVELGLHARPRHLGLDARPRRPRRDREGGRAAARRASRWTSIYWKPERADAALEQELGVRYVTFDELLETRRHRQPALPAERRRRST